MANIVGAKDATMKQDHDLKPCPFCGSDNVRWAIITIGERVSYHVFCDNCGAVTEFDYSDDESLAETIDAWNTRNGISTQ